MAHFIIDNIGPISHTEFELNRVNVFIGPQSIGKSTIAKIISFCLWLEKFTIRQQHTKNITLKFIKSRLISFHKMSSYFVEESHFKFSGNAIEIEYFHNKRPRISMKDSFHDSVVGKVAYIPAERSIVSMANVNSYKLEDDYVRDFVFEWLSLHSKYSRDEAINIPGTTVQFYYDSEKGDVVKLGNNKYISLTESSSGLQALIPLYMYCLYVSHWIYNNTLDMSYEDMDNILDGVCRRTFELLKGKEFSKLLFKSDKYEDNAEVVLSLIKNAFSTNGDGSLQNVFNALSKIANAVRMPHFTQLIIEEPELNLFPETQVELLYAILRLMQNDRKDNLIITTHSPYLLYALNNCMLANIVRDKMPKSKMGKINCSDIILNPNDVSVYELESGSFRPIEQNIDAGKYTIQDNSGLIRQNFFDRVMKEIMDDFNSLLDYRY